MKKSIKLIMIFFAIAIAIIIFKIPTNSYATTIIDKVYVGDIDEPEVGNIPDRMASTVKNYSIYDSVDWLDVTTSRYLNGDDVFELGHLYRVIVWVKANSGYEFKTSGSNPNVSGYINTKSATVNKAYGEAAYEVVELTYDYDLTCMKKIKLAGGSLPQVGQKYPDKNSWYIPDGEHYTRGNRYRWYNDTDDREMVSNDVFELNKVYTLSIVFYPDDGYSFDQPGTIKAVLTDISKSNYSYTITRAGSSSSLEKAMLVEFTFTNLTVRDIEIPEIAIEGGVFPLAGDNPNYSWSAPAGSHYSVSGKPMWLSPNENNYELQPTDTFTKGQTYFLLIVLASDYGYAFNSRIDDVTLTDISDDFYIWSISADQNSITVWLSMTAKNPTNTVCFNTNGGNEIPSQTVDKGETIIRPYPDPIKDGYTFVDWYVGSRYYYVYDFSKPVTSDFTLYAKWELQHTGWENIGNKWYYYDENGTAAIGWRYIDRTWYYFNSNCEMVTGWQRLGNTWYYFDGSGAAAIGWRYIDRTWYYFNSNCEMVTGWQRLGNTWYYFDGSGAAAIGWRYIDRTWYYFNSNCEMVTGWQRLGNTWYYFDGSGAAAIGWRYINSKWYYFDSSCAMVTGWKQIGNKWYYFETSGEMFNGNKKNINGTVYSFDNSGAWIG